MGRTDPLPPYSAPVAFSSSSSSYDPYVDLGRLLARLEQNLLRADSDRWRRLVADEFQRLQARFDVAAARKLLTRVEQSALSIKVLARRQDVQAELNRRRALIDLLQERLDDLDDEARAAAELDRGGDDDDDEEGDEGDDSLAHVVRAQGAQNANTQLPAAVAPPERSETLTSVEKDATDETAASPSAQQPPRPRRKKTNRVRIAAPGDEAITERPTATATASATATAAASRPRRRRQAADAADQQDTARSTSAQVTNSEKSEKSPDRASLFATGADADNAVSTEEAVLDHHRREQEALSEDILRLAHALKEKSLTTSRMLEDDKDVVDRVGDGMNTTTDRLSAASRSMAVLTRMTEGKGWWGRMMLLGMVYGLMLALLLAFLFLPKLRL